MAESLAETVALLRATVGYLGERDQRGWWQCAFFAPGSRAFLAPVFGRTQLLAQCEGVTRAAALVHDERIGVGQVYHLFRCPEDLEQSVHHAFRSPHVAHQIGTLVASSATALTWLQELARTAQPLGVGPTRVGDEQSLRDRRGWRAVAAHYASAFRDGGDVFPYFAGRL